MFQDYPQLFNIYLDSTIVIVRFIQNDRRQQSFGPIRKYVSMFEFRCFPKFRKSWISKRLRQVFFVQMVWRFSWFLESVLVISKGSKGQCLVGRFLESSKNVQTNVAIHPQALIGHSTPIINHKNSKYNNKCKNKCLFVLLYFCPIDLLLCGRQHGEHKETGMFLPRSLVPL